MAVLIEALSVIIKKEAIEREFSDWNEFENFVPNNTLCYDDEIVRVGFMTPAGAEEFLNRLIKKGIKFLENGKAIEIAGVSQIDGILCNCDWLEFGHTLINEKNKIAICRLVGSTILEVFSPANWSYEKSLSENSVVITPERLDKSFKFLRRENGVEVYLNTVTGEEVFIGREE